MKKKVTSIFTALMAVVLCTVLLAQPAFAAAQQSVDPVKIPVTVNLSGPQPSTPEEFKIWLEADDVTNPMPNGAENGKYFLTITGEGAATFDITYSKVGIYKYTIQQEPGKNADCTYDSTVYYLTVYITNKEDGSGLEATAVLYKNPEGEGDKTEAVFNNKYKSYPPDPDDDDDNDEDEEKPPKKPKPEKPEKPSVDTSDNSNVVEYLLAAGACTAVLAGLFFTRKKNDHEE